MVMHKVYEIRRFPKSPELGVAEVAGGLAGLERADASFGEGYLGHVSYSRFPVAVGEQTVPESVPRELCWGEKATLYQIVNTEGASTGVGVV